MSTAEPLRCLGAIDDISGSHHPRSHTAASTNQRPALLGAVVSRVATSPSSKDKCSKTTPHSITKIPAIEPTPQLQTRPFLPTAQLPIHHGSQEKPPRPSHDPNSRPRRPGVCPSFHPSQDDQGRPSKLGRCPTQYLSVLHEGDTAADEAD